MTGTKKWYMSKGVMGGVIAAVAGVAGIFGHEISANVQAEIVEIIISVATVAGGILAAYGRIKADTVVK